MALLIGAGTITWFLIILLSARFRSPSLLFFGTFLIVILVGDAIYTITRGLLYFSKSFAALHVTHKSLSDAAVFVLLFLALFLVSSSWFLRRSARLPTQSHQTFGTPIRLLPLGLIALLGIWMVWRMDLTKDSVRAILATRQLFFEDNYLALFLLNFIPASGLLGALAAASKTTSLPRRIFGLGVLSNATLLMLFSGHRTSLFLGLILPTVAWIIFPRGLPDRVFARSHHGSGIRPTKAVPKLAILGGLSVVAILGSWYYLHATRGPQEELNPYASPDMTAFDSLAYLMEKSGQSFPLTYFSILTVAVPRDVWEEKPISGNQAFSLAHFHERYFSTSTEFTASLVGEGWMNLRWGGVASAALLAAAYTSLVHSVNHPNVRRGRHTFKVVGPGTSGLLQWALLFRGVSLMRSDLLNSGLPVLSLFSLFWACGAILFVRRAHASQGMIEDLAK